MKWKIASQKDDATVIPKSWIHIHYYDALNTLFRIENSLRVFVYVILKNELLDKWADIDITSDDAEQGTIKSIAKKRVHQAQDFGYLGYAINCPVMYLTSGELIRLITDDNYWKYFKPYFPASKQIIKHKLDEIGVIRNSLAHFRPMKTGDVELIKQNANHALAGVEDCLEQLSNCYNVVPTNTKEEWYQSLSTLATELCTVYLFQSNNERWIELRLDYKSQTISTSKYSANFCSHSILNLISPSILSTYGNLTKFATCLTEFSASAHKYTPDTPNFSKTISILFSREVINNNYADIKTDIESLLRTITEETDLIVSDNLARGKLVSISRISASLKSTKDHSWWDVDTDNTLPPITQVDFPEYWGNTLILFSLLTLADKYPWMPVEVSELDLP
jgi:hypothetical protein